jgi:hypothetical protein
MAVIEVKYFNTFFLKKLKNVTNVVSSSDTGGATGTFASQNGAEITMSTTLTPVQMNVGQSVTITYGGNTFNGYIISRTSDTVFTVNSTPSPTITGTPTITFGAITNFDNIPSDYTADAANDWAIEESRIRGGYNNTTVDFGVKAYLDEEDPIQQHRFNSLIYSGIFNSRTGVNNTNQFSVGEDITKSADPANGSIQKLYAEDTNLIIFQEDKVSKALIDKDAIYSAEGNAAVTSTQLVIGQIVAYAGEYGISTNPESFAVYGYRKYFSDKKRGVVLRLSRDGITEISSYGMHDFFRDQLQVADKVVGGWDNHNKNYIISVTSERIGTGLVGENGQNAATVGNNVTVTLNAGIGNIKSGDKIYKYTLAGQITGEFYGTVLSVIQTTNPASFTANIYNQMPALQPIIFWTKPTSTLSFDEGVLGWTSFFSYEPTYITSLTSEFYSMFSGRLYLHNALPSVSNYSQYYGINNDSNVTVVLNSDPSVVKNFKTINYEGQDGWELESMTASSGDVTVPITKYIAPSGTSLNTLSVLESNIFANNFKRKENKFFANLINNSTVTAGEILFGQESTGIKGFFSTVKLKIVNSDFTTKKELFSVSSDVVESSY